MPSEETRRLQKLFGIAVTTPRRRAELVDVAAKPCDVGV